MLSLAVFELLCKRGQRTGPWADGQVTLTRSYLHCWDSPPDSRLVLWGDGWSGPRTCRRQANWAVCCGAQTCFLSHFYLAIRVHSAFSSFASLYIYFTCRFCAVLWINMEGFSLNADTDHLWSVSAQAEIGRNFWQLSAFEIATSLLNVLREVVRGRQTDRGVTLHTLWIAGFFT